MPNKDNKTEEKKCCEKCIMPDGKDTFCWKPYCICHKGGGADKVKKIVAQCLECKAQFIEWISESNICPECEGKVIFFDEVKDTSLERYREEWSEYINKNQEYFDYTAKAVEAKLIADFWLSKLTEVRKATEQKVRGEMVEDVCGILRQIGTVENDEQMENVMLVIKSLLKP